jgi:AcrR family transcriptional regulator
VKEPTLAVEPSLRERKKALTREAIVRAAHRLFSERGFDNVTVAEIADAANVSVKTLFVYFRSKEDLAFADDALLEAMLAALASRRPGTSAAAALAQALIEEVRRQPDGITRVFGWDRAYGESSALQSGLLRRWAHFEDRITEALAHEEGRPASAATRLRAIQLVGLVRCAASAELWAELDQTDPKVVNKFSRWIRGIARGIAD